jgi:hypothetical protein
LQTRSRLVAADGTSPVWLVLLNLKIEQDTNQRRLAEALSWHSRAWYALGAGSGGGHPHARPRRG